MKERISVMPSIPNASPNASPSRMRTSHFSYAPDSFGADAEDVPVEESGWGEGLAVPKKEKQLVGNRFCQGAFIA
jgi:hypothetical protein